LEQLAAEKANAEKKIEAAKDKLALQKREFAEREKIRKAKNEQI